MRPATLTLTMVLSLAVIAAALWHFSVEAVHQTAQIDSAHQHLPTPLSHVWVVISPGFR
jgi:hypothetical protein